MKTIYQKKLAPWYNSQLCALKQTARKWERQWRSSNLEESQLVWKDSLIKLFINRELLFFLSSLIEENKNNPRFLFTTVARLMKSPCSFEPCILLTFLIYYMHSFLMILM